MLTVLFWLIVFPFAMAFSLGFITYNLGEPVAKDESQTETDSISPSA